MGVTTSRIGWRVSCCIILALVLLTSTVAKAQGRTRGAVDFTSVKIRLDEGDLNDKLPPVTPETVPVISVSEANKSLFEKGRSELTPEARQTLEEFARLASEAGLLTKTLIVQGHTCDLGTDDENQRLSEERAKTVTAYLQKRGFASVEFEGYGEERQKFGALEMRPWNRRVDFMVLPEGMTLSEGRKKLLAYKGRSMSKKYLDICLQSKVNCDDAHVLATPITWAQPGDLFRLEYSPVENCYVYVFLLDGGRVAGEYQDASMGDESLPWGRWSTFGESGAWPGPEWPTHQGEDCVQGGNSRWLRMTRSTTVLVVASPQRLPGGIAKMLASASEDCLEDVSLMRKHLRKQLEGTAFDLSNCALHAWRINM